MSAASGSPVLQVARREIDRWRTDGVMQALLLWLPLLASVLLLAIFAVRSSTDLPIAVLDHDDSAASRALITQLDAATGVQVALRVDGLQQARRAMRQSRVYGVVELPEHFQRDVLRGARPQIGLLLNQQSLSAANAVARDVQTVVLTAAGRQSAGLRIAAGLPPQAAAAAARPLRLEIHPLFNPGIDYAAYLGIALLVAGLHCFVVLHGVRAIASEDESGRRAWAQAAGDRAWPALIGKLAPAWGWWWLFGLAVLLGAYAWLGLPSLSALPLFVAGWAALVAAYLSLGAALAAGLPARLAYSGASALSAPAMAFSGVTFPLAAMPWVPRVFGEALPLTVFLHLQSQLVTERLEAALAWPTLVRLLAYAAVLIVVAAWMFGSHWLRAPRP